MKWRWFDLFGGGEVDIPTEPLWRGAATVTHNATTSMRLVSAEKDPSVEIVLGGENGSSVVIGFKLDGLDGFIRGLNKMRELLLVAQNNNAPERDAESDQVSKGE